MDQLFKPQALSPLLVIALTGAIGAGQSFVRTALVNGLASYGYDILPIDISTLIVASFVKAGHEEPRFRNQAERFRWLQSTGNGLRSTHGSDLMAGLCVENINEYISGKSPHDRVAVIIDSLKHPDEVRTLRHVFRECFYLVGVVASEHTRAERLRERKHISAAEFNELSGRDAVEPGIDYGQSTAKTVPMADYFFVNESPVRTGIESEAGRLLRLIFDIGIGSPTRDEYGMLMATRAAGRSACLSRQVGAAIVTSSGMVLATGCNDVPRAGGGLYGPDGDDHRCWARGGKCYNDDEKKLLVEEITTALVAVLEATGRDPDEMLRIGLSKALSSSRVKGLIEFTRAVHAEMDAIIAVARTSAVGLVGSTLYTTTFPCHNCAKHIVAAGVGRVVYLEPYEKSLARKLHGDAIRDPRQEGEDEKIPFDMYSGAAPSRYSEFFEMRPDEARKKDGRFLDREGQRQQAMPRGSQEDSELRTRVSSAAQVINTKRTERSSKLPVVNNGGSSEQ